MCQDRTVIFSWTVRHFLGQMNILGLEYICIDIVVQGLLGQTNFGAVIGKNVVKRLTFAN